jgi:hypothetical protein
MLYGRPFGLLVVNVCLLLFVSGCSLPSDSSLIQQFQGSQAELEQLRRMVDQDNLDGRIHADYADPHLPEARLAEYRRLLKATGVMRLWAHGRAKPLELIVDGDGWLAQGDYKGYLYDLEAQKVSSASLDASCFDVADSKKTQRFCSAFRTLGAGWWLVRYEYR